MNFVITSPVPGYPNSNQAFDDTNDILSQIQVLQPMHSLGHCVTLRDLMHDKEITKWSICPALNQFGSMTTGIGANAATRTQSAALHSG